LFQQDNLIAINLTGFQDQQGSERKIEKIMVIDLLTGETVYEEIFYSRIRDGSLFDNPQLALTKKRIETH